MNQLFNEHPLVMLFLVLNSSFAVCAVAYFVIRLFGRRKWKKIGELFPRMAPTNQTPNEQRLQLLQGMVRWGLQPNNIYSKKQCGSLSFAKIDNLTRDANFEKLNWSLEELLKKDSQGNAFELKVRIDNFLDAMVINLETIGRTEEQINKAVVGTLLNQLYREWFKFAATGDTVSYGIATQKLLIIPGWQNITGLSIYDESGDAIVPFLKIMKKLAEYAEITPWPPPAEPKKEQPADPPQNLEVAA